MAAKVESATGQTVDERLEDFHRRLADSSLAGHWQTRDQVPKLKPWVWRWKDIYAALIESGELVQMGGAGEANNRRTVQLINPALTGVKSTSRTLHVSIQLVKPGETAEAHRHAFNAMRFVVESKGMYTTAAGEQQIMEPGDLLIQPGWAYHDHTNLTDEPAIWLDLLDHPLTRYLDSMAGDVYANGASQPITKPEGYCRDQYGPVRPRTGESGANKWVAYSYKWDETLKTLEKLAAVEGGGDPYDGVLLEYTNPLTGGSTLPTIGAWIQMLRPGEATKPHRHTACTLYHTIQGEGITTVGQGETEDLQWGKRDCFFVPPWQWHQHRNLSKTEPAILFSLTDHPTVEQLGFYREEKG